ncbi:MAG: hypothetical protein NTV94_18160 [Planctomycetota bacterium]|nr:hypothetical protein [Planctomycetota bacterium]
MASKTASRRSNTAPRIAVVYSRYNLTITQSMAFAAIETCGERTGFTPAVFEAPGSYELTSLAMAAARSGRFDGIGVLTTNTLKQAQGRAGLGKDPKNNKGHEAMSALLDTLVTMQVIENPQLAAEILASGSVSDRPDKAAKTGKPRKGARGKGRRS